ncbi:hypothetical protein GALMADRAFT_158435 [Galerina marginata CBS 339.88]|uniref:Uncharacterized protein n=1 Tax=Galerina marginata (strain CBS 339.88) TaxID=685588 RepID=A0A067T2Y0_GALM3|nr:hypothetical protein GALMADRAFT_158435 [Galerina marginata CBS 339.88]
MRLLNVRTLKVEEFMDDTSCPTYTALSHTWGEGEVSFPQISTPAAKSMAGYAKITKCCELASQGGFKYVWIDTCCIDKTSSAELSEAINSMYRWYKGARICYAYLSDVPSSDDPQAENSKFARSRWFTRGWTLQELIAPPLLVFYSSDWVDIGTRSSLWNEIKEITGIPYEVLMSRTPVNEFCVAVRMSWASKRQTTRVEDGAYSLMGIFDVNMPTLYGEGWRAFIRLQLEIMKETSDVTIFAWMPASFQPHSSEDWVDDKPADYEKVQRFLEGANAQAPRCGLLASSPAAFRHSHNVMPYGDRDGRSPRSPFSMTNNGLQIKLPLVKIGRTDIYQAMLDCEVVGSRTKAIAIYLTLPYSREPKLAERYSRLLVDEARYAIDPRSVKLYDIYVSAKYFTPAPPPSKARYAAHISINSPPGKSYRVEASYYNPAIIEFDRPLPRLPLLENFKNPFLVAILLLSFEGKPGCQSIVILATKLQGSPKLKSPELWCIVTSPSTWKEHKSFPDFVKHLGYPPDWAAFQSYYDEVDRASTTLDSGHDVSAAIRPGEFRKVRSTNSPQSELMTEDHQHLFISVTG